MYVFHISFFLTSCAFFSTYFSLLPILPYFLLTFVIPSHLNGSILPNFLTLLSLSLRFPISRSMSAAVSNGNDKTYAHLLPTNNLDAFIYGFILRRWGCLTVYGLGWTEYMCVLIWEGSGSKRWLPDWKFIEKRAWRN